MTELLTAAQMRAIEQAAIDSGEVTGLELMERAGRGVVESILEEWPAMALTSHKAVVLCGPGNNGGDGFVVARLLKERGWEVEVFLYGDEGKLPVDAKANCERWREIAGIYPLSKSLDFKIDEVSVLAKCVENSDIVVDAVFGTGLSKCVAIEIEHAFFIASERPLVAIDILSGLDADSGKSRGAGIGAAITVTFERPKQGHHMGVSARKSGKLRVASIGLDLAARKYGLNHDLSTCHIMDGRSELVSRYQPVRLNKHAASHKYSHGHALILSGPSGKSGAARLAARGALRIGAGLVTVACPPDALAENAAQLNAIMLNPVADATALMAVLQDDRINALCLGPALGLEQRTKDLVEVAMKSGRKVVLDADALTVFSDDLEMLFGMLHKDVVLTPHGGEFGRLFADIAAKLAEPATHGPAYSKVDAAREAAKRAGCVVLFKGADTVIADPAGRAVINSAHYERSAPWLATAGSGDVLAGFITGLMARGFGTMQAAETGAWLHVECALKFGPGLIAEDIAEQLPKVFSDLGI